MNTFGKLIRLGICKVGQWCLSKLRLIGPLYIICVDTIGDSYALPLRRDKYEDL